ncbi:type II secretion system F family protein [Chitinimonas sp. BJYL2]|uniref:type II secretion system F family protein n=1 Tax=Chitinimonas sp. BJYL2 TaxID=2976696 RepID=UPI0022B54645|nr:type II secretion system F family protein [Chitinimonas sp. BJYL2]
MTTLIGLIIGSLIGVSVLLFFYSLSKLKGEVPDEDRAYMDELPPMLRMLWPLVNFFEYHLTCRFPPDLLEKAHKSLRETGVGYLMSAEQYYALRILSALIAGGLTLFCIVALHGSAYEWAAIIGVLGYFYPLIWLSDVRKRRRKEVLKSLPVYLDFITLGVEAGLNLTGAIKQSMEKGPPGALRHEFYMVVRDLRAGVPRADALRRMETRLDMQEITAFVGAVIQAEKMGARLGQVLRMQAEQRRIERFQRAEKLAMEAPVKLILPLIMFIFPVTFIVLAFPIVMKFMQEGML